MWQPLDHPYWGGGTAHCRLLDTIGPRRSCGKSTGFQRLSIFIVATHARLGRRRERYCKQRKEDVMRKLLMAAAAAGTLVATVPASAQIYLGADPDGAGVQVGPFGFGVGPRYGWRGDEYYAYGADCPVVRERVVTPDGRVIYRTQRVCR